MVGGGSLGVGPLGVPGSDVLLFLPPSKPWGGKKKKNPTMGGRQHPQPPLFIMLLTFVPKDSIKTYRLETNQPTTPTLYENSRTGSKHEHPQATTDPRHEVCLFKPMPLQQELQKHLNHQV